MLLFLVDSIFSNISGDLCTSISSNLCGILISIRANGRLFSMHPINVGLLRFNYRTISSIHSYDDDSTFHINSQSRNLETFLNCESCIVQRIQKLVIINPWSWMAFVRKQSFVTAKLKKCSWEETNKCKSKFIHLHRHVVGDLPLVNQYFYGLHLQELCSLTPPLIIPERPTRCSSRWRCPELLIFVVDWLLEWQHFGTSSLQKI